MLKNKVLNIKNISGNIVDVVNKKIYAGTIEVKGGKISKIVPQNANFDNYIIPGFIDSHIHIESSMLIPSEFARAAVISGMVAVVADPHEVANVMGVKGIDFMINNGKKVDFKFYFAAPSCVPATLNETAGAIIDSEQIKQLLDRKEIKCLGELMNVPGVLSNDEEVMAKIRAALGANKPIDGHAPNLSGEDLEKYISSGISTDHECYKKEEAIEKIKLGMKILIREGSAAKDFDALSSLIEEYPDFCMFSSDDRHPNELVKGHINLLVKKAINLGYDKMKVLQCACVNPVRHYNLDVGLLQVGDKADFVEIDNFEELNIQKTVINGKIVSENSGSLIPKVKSRKINNFKAKYKQAKDFEVAHDKSGPFNVIEAYDGKLITQKLNLTPKIENGLIVSDIERDILKIAVINRYKNSKPIVSFIKNFGFRQGAIASSIAHDSHNIIAIGVNDDDIAKAVNIIIKNKGGLALINGQTKIELPLPIAGLMTDKDAFKVADLYTQIENEAKIMGTKMSDPFMTMSFMTLLVIPEMKISDKGIFET